MYGEKMTNHVQKDTLRKSNLAYKRGRANARRQKRKKTAKKKKEANEGKTYERGIGLNLELSTTLASKLE